MISPMKVYHTSRKLAGRKNVRVGAGFLDFPDRYVPIEVTEAQAKILLAGDNWERAYAEDRAGPEAPSESLPESPTSLDPDPAAQIRRIVPGGFKAQALASDPAQIRRMEDIQAEQGVEFQIEIGDDEPQEPAPKRRRRSKR